MLMSSVSVAAAITATNAPMAFRKMRFLIWVPQTCNRRHVPFLDSGDLLGLVQFFRAADECIRPRSAALQRTDRAIQHLGSDRGNKRGPDARLENAAGGIQWPLRPWVFRGP